MEQEFAEGIDSWETMMFLYNSALKEVNTKLEIDVYKRQVQRSLKRYMQIWTMSLVS